MDPVWNEKIQLQIHETNGDGTIKIMDEMLVALEEDSNGEVYALFDCDGSIDENPLTTILPTQFIIYNKKGSICVQIYDKHNEVMGNLHYDYDYLDLNVTNTDLIC